MKHLTFINEILQEAAEIARNHFGSVSGTVKSEDNNQVLTQADLEIGQRILSRIQTAYPGHNIIDEEAGVIDNRSELTWVIDPIDGTSNFAAGLPLYGIMVGLLEGATPVAGGIVLPYFQETYLAEKGSVTTCNGQHMRISAEPNLSNALVAYGIDGHQENPATTQEEAETLGRIVLGIRNLRSSNSAYDAAQTARGRYGCMLNRTSKIWDNVAQQVVIESAGGTYTDFFGQSIDYADPLSKADANFTLCAGAPALHEQVQAIIHS